MKATYVNFPYGDTLEETRCYLKLESKRGLYRPSQDEKNRYYEVWIPWNHKVVERTNEWEEVSWFEYIMNKIF